MKVHERFFIVQAAGIEFKRFFLQLEKDNDLTYGEMTQMLAVELANLAKYQIRSERHPENPDKQGDEE